MYLYLYIYIHIITICTYYILFWQELLRAIHTQPLDYYMSVCAKRNPPNSHGMSSFSSQDMAALGYTQFWNSPHPLDCDLAVRNFSLFDEADVLG